ncbi:50S ribosomal protein L6 [Candidatus Dojkabacteria bacterium]|nr:50S ribosomal protein L6 [Candidatus Dojkabacteria bacterium]
MSRIGYKPIKFDTPVEIKVEKGGSFGNILVTVKGPKGELKQDIRNGINVEVDQENKVIELTRENDLHQMKAYHGLYRSLIANMIEGVTKGYEKNLEIHGVGYRVKLTGNKLDFSLGQNHPIEIEAPEGIEFEVKDEVKIKVKGIDKQLVGKIAAQIREIKKPEPYKGKGIRYVGEYVRRKAGKAAIKATV